MTFNNFSIMSKEQEIKNWIIRWFIENSGFQEADIPKSLNINYFEQGWIDSFAFIEFITDIEQHFSILFSNNDFQDRCFSTIDGLARIIQHKINDKR